MAVNRPNFLYAAARLAALATTLDPVEEVLAVERARRRMAAVLGLDDPGAAAEARRCLLLHRDRGVHSVLALEAEATFVADLVAAVGVTGLDEVPRATGSGLLLVTLHYGPYSSLGALVLEQLALQRRFPPLTFLVDAELEPGLVGLQARRTALAKAGVISSSGLQFVDRQTSGALGVTRQLLAALGRGEAVVVLPDAAFVPPGSRGSLSCRIGKALFGFSRGIDWLATVSGCGVIGAYIEPHGDGHRAVLRAAASPHAVLQGLFDNAVTANPAPWACWLQPEPPF